MGALHYTSKKMNEDIPCIFQAWKEIAFEQRAKKIRHLLSESKNGNQYNNNFDNEQMQSPYDMNNLGSQGMTLHYDNISNQEDDYDDIEQNEEEEFMRVKNSN